MNLSLQRASVEDCEGIQAIQFAGFKTLLDKYQDFDASPGAESLDKIRKRFELPHVDHYFIIVRDERIGCLRIVRTGEDACKLSMICILPEQQGHGCAQQAIREAERLYPQAKHWTLDTIKQEPKLRYLYEKMGYRLTGVESRIKDGMELVDYAK